MPAPTPPSPTSPVPPRRRRRGAAPTTVSVPPSELATIAAITAIDLKLKRHSRMSRVQVDAVLDERLVLMDRRDGVVRPTKVSS